MVKAISGKERTMTKDIDAVIEQKRTLLIRIKEELAVLERAKVLLEGEHGTTIGRKGSKRRKGVVSPDSEAGMAVAILREEGKPLHVDELLPGMKRMGKAATKASVSSTLARFAKKGRVFYRAAAPNTFGLLEWPERPGFRREAV
jgi:hypothetical protein